MRNEIANNEALNNDSEMKEPGNEALDDDYEMAESGFERARE